MGNTSSASIMITAHDNYSEAITAMKNRTTPFRSEVGDLQQELISLNNTKFDLKLDLQRAKNELNEARKAFQDLSTEANKQKLMAAETNYDNLTDSLALVSKQAKQTKKDMENATDAISKADNRASSRSASSDSMLGALGQAGLWASLGQSGAQTLDALVGSAYGSNAGTVFSSLLSGVTSGAAMGSLMGAPGAAIGAAVGGISGLMSGATAIYQQQDESFKSVVQDQYDSIQSDLDSRLESGSSLAAQRETDQIAFSKLLGGDSVASTYLSDLRNMANSTPFLYSDLTQMSKSLAPAFGSDPSRMLSLLTAIGNAGSSVGLGTSDMEEVGTAISRMESTGKTTLEYLNILQERGIDAYGFLADGLGKSKEEMLDMVSKGLIPGADAAQAIQSGMEGAYDGAMKLQSTTFSGLSSTVEGLQQEIDAAMGEGFNTARVPELQRQIDALGGQYGTGLQEAYQSIGTWQGELENEKDATIRKHMESMLSTDEYQTAKAQEDYAEMGRLMGKAQVDGANEYYSGEGYQELIKYQQTLAGDIGQSIYDSGSWHQLGYDMGQQMSEGMMSYWRDNGAGAAIQQSVESFMDTPNTTPFDIDPASVRTGTGFATGLSRVPRDGLYKLHANETVLKPSRAAAYRQGQGGGIQITITGNTIGVSKESDVNAVAAELAGLINLRMKSGTFQR